MSLVMNILTLAYLAIGVAASSRDNSERMEHTNSTYSYCAAVSNTTAIPNQLANDNTTSHVLAADPEAENIQDFATQLCDTVPEVLTLAHANVVTGRCSCENWELASLGWVVRNCNSCGSLRLEQLRTSCAVLAESCLLSGSRAVASRAAQRLSKAEEGAPFSGGFLVRTGGSTVRGFVGVYRSDVGHGYERPAVGVRSLSIPTASANQNGTASPAVSGTEAVESSATTDLPKPVNKKLERQRKKAAERQRKADAKKKAKERKKEAALKKAESKKADAVRKAAEKKKQRLERLKEAGLVAEKTAVAEIKGAFVGAFAGSVIGFLEGLRGNL